MFYKNLLIFFLIVCSSFIIISCKQNNTDISKSDLSIPVAGVINNEPVQLSDIDKTIKQELYDELYRIYIIRKAALNEYFKEYILQSEAKKNNLSKEQYIEKYLKNNLSDKKLSEYIQQYKIDEIPELKRTLHYYDTNSKEGKAILLKSYKDYLINKLVDSLKTMYKPAINIQPPMPPEISLNDIYVHYRGNLNSSVTVIEVSDLECTKCKEYFPVYENIYLKYHDKVKFGFSHFSSYVTLSALGTECAAKQGMFWEMHDSIFKRQHLPDTTDVFLIAKKMNLNMELFTKNFYDPETSSKIEYNFKLLKYCGLFGTPTILINGKPIFNSSSQTDIEKAIEKELEQFNNHIKYIY